MRRLGNPILFRVGAWLVLLWPMVAVPAFAETQGAAIGSLDAWRDRLKIRLDRDLRELQNQSTAPSVPAPATQISGASLPNAAPDQLPEILAGRTEPWLSPVANVLGRHGLSAEFLGVAAIESGFNPSALSPAGARGLWQLMPETARRYGLKVQAGQDERLDPVKSTAAAARYLKDLYAQFQDWPLALAAYNAGERRVQRSLDRSGAKDFWALSRISALPEETRRYVPAVLNTGLAPRSSALRPFFGSPGRQDEAILFLFPPAPPIPDGMTVYATQSPTGSPSD